MPSKRRRKRVAAKQVTKDPAPKRITVEYGQPPDAHDENYHVVSFDDSKLMTNVLKAAVDDAMSYASESWKYKNGTSAPVRAYYTLKCIAGRLTIEVWMTDKNLREEDDNAKKSGRRGSLSHK